MERGMSSGGSKANIEATAWVEAPAGSQRSIAIYENSDERPYPEDNAPEPRPLQSAWISDLIHGQSIGAPGHGLRDGRS